MIPLSLIIAHGLLNGFNYARSFLILLQISFAINSALQINIVYVLIPITIIIYLRKPHVIEFFTIGKPLRKSIKYALLAGILISFIANISLTILNHPLL
jgi:hypothetical protein